MKKMTRSDASRIAKIIRDLDARSDDQNELEFIAALMKVYGAHQVSVVLKAIYA